MNDWDEHEQLNRHDQLERHNQLEQHHALAGGSDREEQQQDVQRRIQGERTALAKDVRALSSMVRERLDVREQLRRHPQVLNAVMVAAGALGVIFLTSLLRFIRGREAA